MADYKVKFYKGDYSARQRAANSDAAVLYVEHHFNGGSATANYALCNVATNAGKTSKAIASDYVHRVAKAFVVPVANNDFASGGVSVGGYNRRGNGNLFYTNMPSVLLEPLFATNPKQAEIIHSEAGRDKLAACLAETIKQFFPHGGLIAFSVGHKYKTSAPRDRGVAVFGGGCEADYAEDVLRRAERLLTK